MNRARHDPAEEQIRKEAYYLWQAAGRPCGHDLDYWLEAKDLVRHRSRFRTARRRRSQPRVNFPVYH